MFPILSVTVPLESHKALKGATRTRYKFSRSALGDERLRTPCNSQTSTLHLAEAGWSSRRKLHTYPCYVSLEFWCHSKFWQILWWVQLLQSMLSWFYYSPKKHYLEELTGCWTHRENPILGFVVFKKGLETFTKRSLVLHLLLSWSLSLWGLSSAPTSNFLFLSVSAVAINNNISSKYSESAYCVQGALASLFFMAFISRYHYYHCYDYLLLYPFLKWEN